MVNRCKDLIMKQLILFFLMLAGFYPAFSQYSVSRVEDSLAVDKLRKLLPSLKDTERINCLNNLSEKIGLFHGDYNSDESRHRGDSIYKYASLAYKEASAINYKYGMSVGLLNLLSSYGVRSNFKDSVFEKAVKDSLFTKYSNRALQLAKEVGDNELLGRAYYKSSDHDDPIINYKKSIDYYHKAGDDKMELEVATALVWQFTGGVEDETAIDYADRCLKLAAKITPTIPWHYELVQWSFINLADLYKAAGDYETALDYIRQSDAYGKAHDAMKMDDNLCELYYLVGKYDSAIMYWHNWKKDYDTYYFGFKATGNNLLGNIYLKQKKYDSAIAMYNTSLDLFKKNGKYTIHFGYGLIRPLLFMGEAYVAKKDYKTAYKYAREGLGFAREKKDKPGMMQGEELMSRIYHSLGKNDSAYSSLLQYIGLKDSLQNKQFLWRLKSYKKSAEDEKKQARLMLLDKDNKLKDAALKQKEGQNNLLLVLLSAILLAGIFVSRIVVLNRKADRLRREQLENSFKVEQLENQKKQAELQQQAVELEMQALRAQMNPHFIFNCLNSINRIILRNDSQSASDYLTRFSRLIRMVLVNSQLSMIPLEDELHMLRLYLDMERLRFKDAFNYSIIFTNAIDEESVMIPPLLLQPFCENAVWHGLMQLPERQGIAGQGRLTIELSMQDKVLQCIISDNGIGREASAALKSKTAGKQKSMGLEITAQRLALLNQHRQIETHYTIEDVVDDDNEIAGTRVILRICYGKMVGQIV
jgi:hypothetical protein